MNHLNQLIILSFLLPLSTIVRAENIDRTLDVKTNGRINIEIMDGDINVIGWDKPQVRVVGDVPVSFGVESVSAGYVLKNIDGQVRGSTLSGNLTLDGGVGRIILDSVSGNVIVDGASGRLNLSSVSGNIKADSDAEQFDAQTVSGNISARIGSSNRINLESISGDIELQLNLNDEARLYADTVSGNIDIDFGSDAINATFDIETGPGGEVKNRVSSHRTEENGFSFSESMRFKLGSGNSDVNLETMSGRIEIDQ